MRLQGNGDPFVSKAPKLGFVGGYDGLRGIGVMMVLFGHSYLEKFLSWTPLVDLFFIISGFLITSLLLQEHRNTGEIKVRKFYARRAIRLLPSLWLMLATAFVLSWIFAKPVDFHIVTREVIAAFFYVYHLVFPVSADVYRHSTTVGHGTTMGQLWSLSVEEQFYFVAAILVIVLVAKNWIRQALVVLIAFIAFVGIARWTYHPGPDLLWIQRPDGLAIGVAAALVNAHVTEETGKKYRRPMLWISGIGIVIFWMVMWSGSLAFHKIWTELWGLPLRDAKGNITYGLKYFYFPTSATEVGYSAKAAIPPPHIMYFWRYAYTLADLAVVPGVVCLARYKDWGVSRFFTKKPFMFLGRLSYTLYVWHGFLFVAINAALINSMPHAEVAAIEITVAFVVSLAVFYGVERPAINWKNRYSSEKEFVNLNTGSVEQGPDRNP